MLKLGTLVKDEATGLKGMLTHMQLEMNGTRWYRFQPKGINPETGEPVKGMWIAEQRVIGGEECEDYDFPEEILGSEVEDIGSGFKGIATGLIMHTSGCLHVNIQPRGALKTGEPIQAHDFDIRRCKGKKIKPMKEKEIKQDQKRRPSPAASDTTARFNT